MEERKRPQMLPGLLESRRCSGFDSRGWGRICSGWLWGRMSEYFRHEVGQHSHDGYYALSQPVANCFSTFELFKAWRRDGQLARGI